jgi:hypothetical protein
MKKLDSSRPSLVEFLGSIKFARSQEMAPQADESREHFARLQPITRRQLHGEETQLIRSAN